MTPPAPAQVLAVLDDTRAASALLDISCTLAQLTHRELQLVYVESATALAAAALPATQVLALATARWAPLAPPDVERAWLAEAGRLRTLAGQASLRSAVAWSMRVTRGTLHETARALQAQSDLLLVGGTAATLALAVRPAPRRLIVALDDGSSAGRQALAIAGQLCKALAARLQVQRLDPGHGNARWLPQADLVVMPGPLLGPMRAATLLVSRNPPAGS